MGVLRGRLLQPHGQSYFNDAALATLLAIGIDVLLDHAIVLNLCANTAFQVKLQRYGCSTWSTFTAPWAVVL